MKSSFTILLLALLCCSALSAFKAKQSVTVSGVTYSIGNNGNDCGVTRKESGTTVSWYYTSGLGTYGDCIGQNIFALASTIAVVLTVNSNADILNNANAVTGDTTNYDAYPVAFDSIIVGEIDTSSVSGTFGKFSYGTDSIAIDTNNPAPVEFVSAAGCDDKNTVQVTLNVDPTYKLVNFPSSNFVDINGNGVKQIFDSTLQTFTAYEAKDAPFCTSATAEEEESSGFATWKLALIISLPIIAILIALTIFLHIKTTKKAKEAAKMQKFKEVPSSPTSPTEVENKA